MTTPVRHDVELVATKVAADHGIDLASLWWVDRPDRAAVTAGVPGTVMAAAIGQTTGCPRFENQMVEIIDQDLPQAMRAGTLLARNSDGSRVALSSSGPIADTPTLICTDRELIQLLCQQRADEFTYKAVHTLYDLSPEHSARYVLSRRQLWYAAAMVLALVAGLWLAPTITVAAFLAVTNLFLLCAVVFKVVAVLAGVREEPSVRPNVKRPANDDIPYYSVLAPVFREPEVVQHLAAALSRLDYPLDRIEILLLIEEEDTETPAALGDDIPGNLFAITVPASQPQTKPKACNWSLNFARGQHLVIYDAEDVPDPDQLLIALETFREPGNEDVLAVQAALDYWNDDHNAITRLFALEYAWWFQFMLPGLSALNVPIPLGGTSNHFRSQALRDIGGWDGFNVTEDADLGIRAAAEGWRIAIIHSFTAEEASSRVKQFIKQRSRWIKGYEQSALVRLRHPVELARMVGFRGLLSFVFLIAGTPFTFLVTPILWLLLLVELVASPAWLEQIFAGIWGDLAFVNLVLINALVVWLNMFACTRRNREKLIGWSLLNPVYWLLHSAAAYMATWELIRRPWHWQKTAHGLVSKGSD